MARVLTADDDATTRALLRYVLEQQGHQVYETEDGASALTAARDLNPDLVILDMHMPVLSGNEVCRSLRSTPDVAGVPVILLTADADFPDARANACLAKPFSPAELVGLVQQLLSGAPADARPGPGAVRER